MDTTSANPLLWFDAGKFGVQTLGDPHNGRQFKNGVPLDRRGEREATQRQAFQAALNDIEPGVRVHVCMGDLFDKSIVAPEIVIETANAYILAARAHPHVNYYVLMGNHDAFREADRRSSFDLFRRLVGGVYNICVVYNQVESYGDDGVNLIFAPWDPFKSAAEMLEGYTCTEPADAIFGHWDIKSYGGDDRNVVPPKAFELAKLVVTGHVHTPQKIGERLIVTGSMLPYTHDEDPEHNLYVTLTKAEFEAADPTTLRDKCVRVLLEPGEETPEGVDCLQLTWKRKESSDEPLEVKMETFDFQALFHEVMQEENVDCQVISNIWQKYQDTRNEGPVE